VEITSTKLQQGNQTPSTVTDSSTPDTTTTERLDQVENRIQDVHKWMNEMVTLMRKAKVDSTMKRYNPATKVTINQPK
jgi:hypothetical protein